MNKHIHFTHRITSILAILALTIFILMPGKGWGQTTAKSITSSSAVTDYVGSYAGTSGTLPSYWGQLGNGANGTNQAGSNQGAGTSGGWYGSGISNAGGMSFLGSSSASNGNGTLALQNNTGSSITGFILSYTAKMFKSGGSSPTVSVSWSNSPTLAVQPLGALGNPLASLGFSDATASISTGTTLTQTVNSISIPNGQYIYIRWIHTGAASSDNLGWNNISFTPSLASSGLTPPVLTAASSPTVDANFNITFTDDATWRGLITAVKYGTTTLTATTDYTIASGVLTLKPSVTIGCILRTASSAKITVFARYSLPLFVFNTLMSPSNSRSATSSRSISVPKLFACSAIASINAGPVVPLENPG